MEIETIKEAATKEGIFRASQNNFNQAEAGYNAKWFIRGALFGAKWQSKQQDDFAIGFLSWYKIHGKWITKHLEDFELLDLYKKEIKK